MPRIAIRDLPKDTQISKQEMKDVTGGFGRGSRFSFLANPWLLKAVVASATAIPLAVGDDDDDDAP